MKKTCIFSVIAVFVIVLFTSCNKTITTDKISYKHPIEFNPEKYVCYKTAEPIIIDGKIDNQWDKIEWTNDFKDIQGDNEPTPEYKTNAKIAWDDEYLYFAAKLEDPHIWAKLRMRDTVIFYDNDFEIFIDPTGNTHKYYEFEMNAFNTIWDLLLEKPYRDGCQALFGWDIRGIKSAVHIEGTINNSSDTDKFWSVEVAMPWKILKEYARGKLPKENEQWRIGFSRVEWWTDIIDGAYIKKNGENGKHLPEENWVWGSTGFINMHMPEMWPFVQFTHTIAGEKGVNFIDNPDEQVKWALRQLYYMQNKYKAKNGSYSSTLDAFEFPKVNLENYKFTPSMENTSSYYEISVPSANGEQKILINNQGMTWVK